MAYEPRSVYEYGNEASAVRQPMTDAELKDWAASGLLELESLPYLTDTTVVAAYRAVLRLLADQEGRGASGWQPIETLTEDNAPVDGFLVYWPISLTGRVDQIDRVGGLREYEEIIGFGEPPATHWMPLPSPPQAPTV